jgi:MFS family permease
MADETNPPPAPVAKSGGSFWAQIRASLPRNVLALGVVSFLTDSSSEMMMWTLPFYISLLGGGLVWVGLVEGLRETTASLVTVGSGWLSDRIRNRKVLVVVGYGISMIVKPILALAGAPWHVLLLTSAERVGKGIRGAPRDALVAGAVASENLGKAFSFHRMMDHAGASVGQIVGVLLAIWMFPYFHRLADAGANLVPADVFRWMYVLAAVPAAMAVLAILFFVRETHGQIKKKVQLSFRDSYDRRFWALLAAMLVFALGNSSDMFLLLRAGQILNYPIQMTHADTRTMAAAWDFPWQLPLMFFILNVSKMVFTMPGGFLADRIGRTKTLLAGWLIYAGVYFAFGFADQAWEAWALFVTYGLFYGFTEGVQKAIVADFVRPEVRGAAYGLAYFCDGIAKFPASLLLGIIYAAAGPAWAFGFGGACAAAACVLLAGAMWAFDQKRQAVR